MGYKQEYAKVMAAYKKAIAKLEDLKAKVVAKMTVLKNQVTVAVMPVYKECKKYVDVATNEITEAAKFCYNYYNVQATLDKIQAKVEAEYRRIDPVVRKAIIDFLKMLKKEFETYKKQAEELMAIYQKQGLRNLQEIRHQELEQELRQRQGASRQDGQADRTHGPPWSPQRNRCH